MSKISELADVRENAARHASGCTGATSANVARGNSSKAGGVVSFGSTSFTTTSAGALKSGTATTTFNRSTVANVAKSRVAASGSTAEGNSKFPKSYSYRLPTTYGPLPTTYNIIT